MFWDERIPILIQIFVQHDPKISKITTFQALSGFKTVQSGECSK